MAKGEKKCPNCGIELKWDWEQDNYRTVKGAVATLCKPCLVNVPVSKRKITSVSVFVCNKCGCVLGFMVDDEGTVYNHPDLDGIDWE